jgi:nickel-dependent lactate racemase
MPEIWLGYGDSEVILDIKYENILDNNKAEFLLLDNESLNLELEDKIQLKNSTLILTFTPFLQMIPILKDIKEKSNRFELNNIEFSTLSKNIPFKIKRILNDNGITINRIENNEVLNVMKSFEKTILLEKIEYDPFFGYKGASTELMRSSFPDKMNHAYSTIIDKIPQPGIITEPLNISLEASKTLNFESIHVIANNNGINSIYSGDTEYSFKNAIEIFDKISKKKIEKAKSVFITGNSNFNLQATLSNSLNLLWNNYQAVKENGIIILLSENKLGLGNGALLQFIENRLDQTELKKNQYKKDLEHINYLNLIKDKFDIYAISTIPKVYLNKLGFKTLSKIKDGLETILMKHGKNSKILIISNSEITRILESANQN